MRRFERFPAASPTGGPGRLGRLRFDRVDPDEAWAWAALSVTFLAGVARAGPEPEHLLLAALWVSVYLTLRLPRGDVHTHTSAVAGGVAAGSGLVLGLSRPDLIVPVLGGVLLACAARAAIALARPAALWRRTLAALPAGAFALVVYLAGYPADGTIAVGRRGALVAALAATAFVLGAASWPRRDAAALASAVYHGAWAGVWGAVAVWPTRPPGVPRRASAALAVLFAALAVIRSPAANRRPRDLVLAAESASVAALLAIVAQWR